MSIVLKCNYFLLQAVISFVVALYFSSCTTKIVPPVDLPPHSVLLQIDEVNTLQGDMYQATLTLSDTVLVSPPLIRSNDLRRILAREGKIYTNYCIGAHEKLFQTFRSFIELTVLPHDTIYLILNGLSWNLAVEAIPMASSDEHLCDKYYFRRISSVKQISQRLIRQNVFQTVLFGDMQYHNPKIKDLIGSKHAIAYLRELYSSKGFRPEIYSQDRATANAFLSLSGKQADNVLVSTHGIVREQPNGLPAYEVLFDNAVGVSAPTIAKMDLSHIQTIFFTACHSANYYSENEVCLRTALKEAGANSVIFHIWQTNDHAAEIFMKTYYTAWLDGQSPREAFLTAKYTVRDKMEEPQYWAGFIMLD